VLLFAWIVVLLAFFILASSSLSPLIEFQADDAAALC